MVTATGIAPGSEMTAQMEQVEERNVSGVLHIASIFASHMVLQRNKQSTMPTGRSGSSSERSLCAK